MTQAELSARSGLGRGHISRIETGGYKNPSQITFERLARGLGLGIIELRNEIRGETLETPFETPEDILERLKLVTPISVPVYSNYPFHAGDPTEPVEYVYHARTRKARRTVEGYIVHGKCLEPRITDGDIIIVDREASIDNGDIVACLIDDQLRLGYLRKIADELWLENGDGRVRFEECQMAAPVTEVIRRLK